MKANNIVAVAWRDTKRLTTWSTVHLDNTIGKKIQSQDGGAKEVAKPVLVESYNQHMSGVDIIDQISRTSLHKEKHNFNMKMFKFWLWCQRLCLWYHEWLKADYKPDSSIHPFCSPMAKLNRWLGTQKLSGADRSAQTRQAHINSHAYTCIHHRIQLTVGDMTTSGRWLWWWYQSLTAHQHQKGHTVPDRFGHYTGQGKHATGKLNFAT